MMKAIINSCDENGETIESISVIFDYPLVFVQGAYISEELFIDAYRPSMAIPSESVKIGYLNIDPILTLEIAEGLLPYHYDRYHDSFYPADTEFEPQE